MAKAARHRVSRQGSGSAKPTGRSTECQLGVFDGRPDGGTAAAQAKIGLVPMPGRCAPCPVPILPRPLHVPDPAPAPIGVLPRPGAFPTTAPRSPRTRPSSPTSISPPARPSPVLACRPRPACLSRVRRAGMPVTRPPRPGRQTPYPRSPTPPRPASAMVAPAAPCPAPLAAHAHPRNARARPPGESGDPAGPACEPGPPRQSRRVRSRFGYIVVGAGAPGAAAAVGGGGVGASGSSSSSGRPARSVRSF